MIKNRVLLVAKLQIEPFKIDEENIRKRTTMCITCATEQYI